MMNLGRSGQEGFVERFGREDVLRRLDIAVRSQPSHRAARAPHLRLHGRPPFTRRVAPLPQVNSILTGSFLRGEFSDAFPRACDFRYEPGQQYRAHNDFFDPKRYGDAFGLKDQGQRVATCITYLNTVPRGGGTRFPVINATVPALKGRSVMFRSVTESGQLDLASSHAGMPVLEGVKYAVVQWLREKPF
jgi:2OG-Fe(II) oxygenase superfamily